MNPLPWLSSSSRRQIRLLDFLGLAWLLGLGIGALCLELASPASGAIPKARAATGVMISFCAAIAIFNCVWGLPKLMDLKPNPVTQSAWGILPFVICAVGCWQWHAPILLRVVSIFPILLSVWRIEILVHSKNSSVVSAPKLDGTEQHQGTRP